MDRVCLQGTGTPPQPKGITATSGVGSVSIGTNGAQFTNTTAGPKLLDTIGTVWTANDIVSALVMHPRSRVSLEKLTDTTNQPLRLPDSVANTPKFVTSSLSITEVQGTSGSVCSSIVLGNFAQLIIGIRTALRIEILRELYAANLHTDFWHG